MTLRSPLTSAIAALAVCALPALAQTPPPAAAPAQSFTVPPHNCVAPEYPTKEKTERLKGDAYNRAVEAFNRDYKTYGECIKKYVDNTNVWIKQTADSANKAIDEYNKYTADLKATIESEKK
jgi:hypothetical protein